MYVYKKSDAIQIIEKHDLPEPDRIVLTVSSEKNEIARNIFRKLKHGSGFEGWTPSFFGVLKM